MTAGPMGSPWDDDGGEVGSSWEGSGREQLPIGGDDRGVKGLPNLRAWVEWYVRNYEAWDSIPPCWAEHPAMVNELQAAMELRLALDVETAGDVAAASRARAEWHDYRGRAMERLGHSPGAVCAQRREHREPVTWDREASAERRREARRSARLKAAG